MSAPDPSEIKRQWATTRDRLTFLLSEYRIPVTLAAIAAAVGVATGTFETPALPAWLPLFATGVASGLIPAAVISTVIVSKLVPDPRPRVLLIDPDPTASDGWIEIEKYAVPADVWDERNGGEIPPLNISNVPGSVDYVVTRLDWEENTQTLLVEGANEELADPLSIVARNQRLTETFENMLESQMELERYRANESRRAIEIEKETVNAVLAALDAGTSINPDDPRDVIDMDLGEPADPEAVSVSEAERPGAVDRAAADQTPRANDD